jgi:hypothetical protein
MTEEEFREQSKLLAKKELELIQTEIDKDLSSREYNERLKKLRGEIAQLARAVDEEKLSREASDAEAPWDGMIEEAQTLAQRGRARRAKQDRTGEYPDEVDATDGGLEEER